MIITRSHFKGLIDIAASQDGTAPNSKKSGNATKLENFMEAYERDYLIKTLGYYLFTQFQMSLEVASGKSYQTVKDSADIKWKRLYSGYEYEIDGVYVVWNGLNYTFSAVEDAEPNRSPIADYVYFHFMMDDATIHTPIGVEKPKGKNSDGVNASPKIIAAWRDFYNKTVGGYGVATVIHSDIGIGIDYAGTNETVRSLYQFINDMNILTPGTFEKWTPYNFVNMNNFGF